MRLRNLRYLRWRLRPAELMALVVIVVLCSAALGVAIANTVPKRQETREERAQIIYSSWNDMAASMREENIILDELQQNLKDNPPHLVFDTRRRELYAAAIAAHQQQLADLKQIQESDR